MLIAALGPNLGLDRDEVAWLWPCNVDTWYHWHAVQTQWRVGMAGERGLDYSGVWKYIEVEVPEPQRREVFAGIRAAEFGDIEGNAEAAKRNKK